MEILIILVSLAFLVVLIVLPIITLKRLNKQHYKFKFLTYIFIVVTTTLTVTLIFAWWNYFSNQLLLKHFGYNFNATIDIEKIENVDLENREKAKNLETSLMGIGWPLKAFISYTLYFPYLFVVYFIIRVIEKRK